MERPEIKRENGATSIDIVLTLKPGFACRTVTALANECQKFLKDANLPDGKERKAYLLAQHKKEIYELRFTSCLELMAFGGEPGKKGVIKVDGEDEAAEKIALRLYSALTSEDAYNLDFYQFEPELRPKE